MRLPPPYILLLLAAGCGPSERDTPALANAADTVPGPIVTAPAEPMEPIPPGEPGGLPDDRTPISEAPFTETSAQGAANVVQTYFALAESAKLAEGRRLWRDGASADAFARAVEAASEYHAQIGAPGAIEGAAGSLFVEVPVQVYGRLKTGAAFRRLGKATLRRVNDVPGSTAEQRKWHIAGIALGQSR